MAAKINVTDPYIVSYTGEKAANWSDMAPLVAGRPAPKDSVLQIFVPAENTTVDYGAGKIPGIRMATDHHVHLTAMSPLTTLSLGAPAGLGVAGAAGLNLYTAGAKAEEVMKDTNERHHGAWSGWCGSTRDEHVTGGWSQVCESAFTQACKSYSLSVNGESKYTYTGNSTVTYDKNCKTTVTGQSESHYLEPKLDWHYGLKTAFFAGADVSVNFGIKQSTFLGLAQATNLAANMNINATQNLSLNLGVDVAMNASLCISRTLIGSSKTQIDLDNSEMELKKKIAEIVNEKIGISSSGLKVMK